MNPKTYPTSGTPIRKYIEIHETWPAEGSDFDPKGELNSDTQAPVTFSKKNLKKLKKIIQRFRYLKLNCRRRWHRHWRRASSFYLLQTTVRVSFSSPAQDSKLIPFWAPFFDNFFAKNCSWQKICKFLKAVRGIKNEPPLASYTARAFTTNHWHIKPGRFETIISLGKFTFLYLNILLLKKNWNTNHCLRSKL